MTSLPLAASLDPDRLAPEAGNPAVAAVMRDEVVFCLPSTPIDAVAKLMADNDLHEIVVLLDRRPVGYVMAEDIVDCLVGEQLSVSGSDFAVRAPSTEVKVDGIMRTPALLVDEHQRLNEVVSVMAQNQRQTAVVMHEDETPVGMVTPRELADHLLSMGADHG